MKYTLVTTIGFALATFSLKAEWVQIDSFEDGAENPRYTFVTQLGARDTPTHNFVADPGNPDNTVFWIDPVAYGQDWMVIYANWTLETPIPDNSKGTLYLRFYATESNSMGPVVGLTDKPFELDAETGLPAQPTSWDVFRGSASLADTTLSPWDSTWYMATDYTFTPGNWYEIWAVIFNNEGVAQDESKWFVKGPEDAEPVHVKIPNANGEDFETALMRSGTTEDLVGFYYGILAGDPAAPLSGIPSYIDDVYIDVTGENITTPAGVGGTGDMTWGGYPMDAAGNVDTGDWMGWLRVQGDFVFSFSLDSWLYMPEPAEGAVGGWGYVFK